MLIECPRCAARYDVAAALIGPAGKSVRCAKCGNVWLARLPEDAQAPAEPPPQWPEPPQRAGGSIQPGDIPAPPVEAEDPALAELRAAQQVRGGKGGAGFAQFPTPSQPSEATRPRFAAAAAIGWVVTLIVLGAAGWAGYTYRDAVVQAWPPSERIYLALGLRP